jgi:hypothetical protein
VQVDATRIPLLSPVPEGDSAPPDVPPEAWSYWDQPFAYRDREVEDDRLPADFPYLVYLKVWDTLVTAIQDPSIRETALGSALPDTAARARTVWQVLPVRLEQQNEEPAEAAFERWLAGRAPREWLAARAERPARVEDDPCVVAPDSRFRGPENQLYRVEIHAGTTDSVDGRATFKWSRDNGSVTFPVASVSGPWVTLAALGRDDKLDLHVGNRVEVLDDASVGRGVVSPLPQVMEIDLAGRRVRLSEPPGDPVGTVPSLHPYLRRWDHTETRRRGAPRLIDGAVEIKEGQWIDLEDGVQVWFGADGRYRAGDYWLIPARTIPGTVEWPQDSLGRPLLARPSGVEFHYAPLAWVTGPEPTQVQDLRKTWTPLAR